MVLLSWQLFSPSAEKDEENHVIAFFKAAYIALHSKAVVLQSMLDMNFW